MATLVLGVEDAARASAAGGRLMRLYVEPMDAVVVDVDADGRVRLENEDWSEPTLQERRAIIYAATNELAALTELLEILDQVHRAGRLTCRRRSSVICEVCMIRCANCSSRQGRADHRRQAHRPRGRRPAGRARRRRRARLRAVAGRGGAGGRERARVGPACRDCSGRSLAARRLPGARQRRGRETLGRIDILLNMASVYVRRPFDELTVADWDRTPDVDLRGGFLCALAAVPHMRRQGGGRIINFSDWTARSGRPRYRGYLPYYVAKAGVIALTEALALELAVRQHPGQRDRAGADPRARRSRATRSVGPSKRPRRSAGGAARSKSPRRARAARRATSSPVKRCASTAAAT